MNGLLKTLSPLILTLGRMRISIELDRRVPYTAKPRPGQSQSPTFQVDDNFQMIDYETIAYGRMLSLFASKCLSPMTNSPSPVDYLPR